MSIELIRLGGPAYGMYTKLCQGAVEVKGSGGV